MTPQRAVVATTTTDQAGKFTVTGLADGQYLVVARYPPLAERQALGHDRPASRSRWISCSWRWRRSAGRDGHGQPGQRSHPWAAPPSRSTSFPATTSWSGRRPWWRRRWRAKPRVNLQRTSPGMAGIFVRGLTGNKVNVFVDGVRYSNGAQRGGVNTFLDLIDPSTPRQHRSAARHVERAVRQRRAGRQRPVPDERGADRPRRRRSADRVTLRRRNRP